MSKLARVNYGTAQLPSGKKIEVGFRQWYEWLEHPETKSFRVDDGEGYTARKETTKGYWYAYRKVEGKLHKRYIGVSKALTLRRLAEVGELFDIPSQPKLPKPVGNSRVSEELQNQIGNLQVENEALKAELAEVRKQLSTQSDPAYHTDVIALKKELKAEIQRFKDTENSLRGNDASWQMRVTALTHELGEAEAKLLRQYDTNRKLEKELAEVRWRNAAPKASQLSEFVEFPDAADLLNQLKSKRNKSKTDLQDVEAILELLPEIPAQQPQAQLPDLYAARDKLFEMPSLGGWKLEKGEKRERFWAFANAMIEEAAKLDPNYSLLARLQSDLKQEQEYSKGLAKGMSEEFTKRVNIEKKMGLRR